jgi:hypothetical protein
MPKIDETKIREDVEVFDMIERYGGILVVAGLIIEFVHAIIFRQGKLFFEAFGPTIANGAVAIGVAAEVYFAGLAKGRSAELDRISEEKVTAANLSADEARERAANAELETAKVKAAAAWRTLSGPVAQSLTQFLSFRTGKVTIQYVANDPEALYFTVQLSDIFEAAHWTVSTMSMSMPGMLVMGLYVPESSPVDTPTIRSSFAMVGLGFSAAALPDPGVLISTGSKIENAAIVFVGSKPPLR